MVLIRFFFLLLFSFPAFANTGFLSHGVCFETAQEASDNYYSLFVPITWVDPLTGTNTKYYAPQLDGFHFVWTQNGAVFSNTLAPTKILTSCLSPSESFQDGITLGWYVVAAMISVLSVVLIRKAIP